MAALAHRLAPLASGPPVPLLVVRLRDLERIAWREGRQAARTVERRSLKSFVATAARTLRATDLLAHDAESEDFLIALVSPNRKTGSVATPTDCRATLARVAAAMEVATGQRVETGWTVLHGVACDPTLARGVEAALERGARERERYAFFSTIGHELRTPLTSIRGYLETLLEEDLDPATSRRFLEVARHEALRLGRLVDGMFDVSMLDLRAQAVPEESCEVGAAVGAAVLALAIASAARGTSVQQLAAGACEVAVGADRLVQIVINVVENAIKHGRPSGRVIVSVATLDASFVEVRVDDDGPGVPASERDAIFSLARRGTTVTARGSGLGLAVVRLMLERIGGEVDVGVSPLEGAQFRIRLPRARPEPALAAAAAAGPQRVS